MKIFTLVALAGALSLGACTYTAPPPPPPPPPSLAPAPPPPPPPPGALSITGSVTEKAGFCHTVVGDNGVRYAVRQGVLGPIPTGARIRVVGTVAARQDCPGSTVIRVSRVARIG